MNRELMLLHKNVSSLHATYQIRLLLHAAVTRNLKLKIVVPKSTRIENDLRALVREHPRHAAIERYEPREGR